LRLFPGVGDFERFRVRSNLETVLRLKPPRFRYKHLSNKKSKEKTLEVYENSSTERYTKTINHQQKALVKAID
jgi:hypothetical protein